MTNATKTKITTVEQAKATIARIESQDTITHADRQLADGIYQAIQRAEQYADLGEQIEGYDQRGNVVMREQAIRQRDEFASTRMSDLAKRLAGIE